MQAIARIVEDGKAAGVVCAIHRSYPSNQIVSITNGLAGASIPQLNIGGGDGLYLSEIIANSPPDSPPRVRLVVDGTMKTDWTTQNTYGLIRGTTDEYLVFQAHTDGYFEAARDNASGVAMLLGLARHKPRSHAIRSDATCSSSPPRVTTRDRRWAPGTWSRTTRTHCARPCCWSTSSTWRR